MLLRLLTWLVYALAIGLQWYKRWLVVREYTKRPKWFMIPGPSGALMLAGWLLLALAYALIAISYSILFAAGAAAATGLLLHAVARFYFRREVEYWMKYDIELTHRFYTGTWEILPGYVMSKPPGSAPPEEQIRKEAEEYAVEMVLRIRKSPIGKGTSE